MDEARLDGLMSATKHTEERLNTEAILRVFSTITIITKLGVTINSRQLIRMISQTSFHFPACGPEATTIGQWKGLSGGYLLRIA
jgi:hypothetical protein